MSHVFVGALKLDLQILESRSLKDKRMVLRRIKDRVRERLGLVVVEVGAQELWQRAELGVACTSGERAKVGALLDDVRRCVVSTEGTSLLREWRDLSGFAGQAVDLADEAFAGDLAGDRDGRGDGPSDGPDDGRGHGPDAWVPAQWQQALEQEARGEPADPDASVSPSDHREAGGAPRGAARAAGVKR